jgi:AcrR family transcriptional regulator
MPRRTATPPTKRERTRAALLKAALELVDQRGFEAASLDDIAARAGMTKGAIYSNFANKAELLMAAMADRGLTLTSERAPAESLKEELRATAASLTASLRSAKREARLLSEFQLYALNNPELRAGLAAVYARAFDGTAAYLQRLIPDDHGVSPRHIAVALQALALGFMVQSLFTPDEIDEVVIRETFEALATGFAE